MLCDKTLQLVPNDELVDRDFLLQGLRRDPYRGFVERSANGTEAKNITQETLRAAPFWIPSLSKQRAIVERLRQFAAALIAAQEQRTSLEKLRSTFINEVVQ
jgi:restriction endonuclease S subunit